MTSDELRLLRWLGTRVLVVRPVPPTRLRVRSGDWWEAYDETQRAAGNV